MIADLTQSQSAAIAARLSWQRSRLWSWQVSSFLWALIAGADQHWEQPERCFMALYSCIPPVFHKSCQVSFLIVGYVIRYAPLPCPHPFPDITLDPALALVQFCWSTPPWTSECSESFWLGESYGVWNMKSYKALSSLGKKSSKNEGEYWTPFFFSLLPPHPILCCLHSVSLLYPKQK